MAGTKKDDTVTYYPAEGVYRSAAGNVLKDPEPVAERTPAFTAPSGTVPAPSNVEGPPPTAPNAG